MKRLRKEIDLVGSIKAKSFLNMAFYLSENTWSCYTFDHMEQGWHERAQSDRLGVSFSISLGALKLYLSRSEAAVRNYLQKLGVGFSRHTSRLPPLWYEQLFLKQREEKWTHLQRCNFKTNQLTLMGLSFFIGNMEMIIFSLEGH